MADEEGATPDPQTTEQVPTTPDPASSGEETTASDTASEDTPSSADVATTEDETLAPTPDDTGGDDGWEDVVDPDPDVPTEDPGQQSGSSADETPNPPAGSEPEPAPTPPAEAPAPETVPGVPAEDPAVTQARALDQVPPEMPNEVQMALSTNAPTPQPVFPAAREITPQEPGRTPGGEGVWVCVTPEGPRTVIAGMMCPPFEVHRIPPLGSFISCPTCGGTSVRRAFENELAETVPA